MDKQVNFEELAGKYPLLRKVIDGDTTLEETLKEYEDEFYALNSRGARLIKLPGKNLEDSIKTYEAKMDEFICIIEETWYAKMGMEMPDISRHAKGERGITLDKLYRGGFFVGMGGVVTFPLGLAIGWKWVNNEGPVTDAERYIKGTRDTFTYLREQAAEIDQVIHRSYIAKYIKEKPELFKEIYGQMSKSEKKQVEKNLEILLDVGALDMSAIELERLLKEIKSKGRDSG